MRKHWLQPSAQCGNIDANSVRNVETLTPTQRTMWKYWHQLSAQCGNIDTISSQGSTSFWDFWLISGKPSSKSKFCLYTSNKMIFLLNIAKILWPLLGPFKRVFYSISYFNIKGDICSQIFKNNSELEAHKKTMHSLNKKSVKDVIQIMFWSGELYHFTLKTWLLFFNDPSPFKCIDFTKPLMMHKISHVSFD